MITDSLVRAPVGCFSFCFFTFSSLKESSRQEEAVKRYNYECAVLILGTLLLLCKHVNTQMQMNTDMFFLLFLPGSGFNYISTEITLHCLTWLLKPLC